MLEEDKSMVKEALDFFKSKFNMKADLIAFAPGRANLIGEHTDYNDGFVLPFALPHKTIIVGCKSNTSECTIYSTSMKDSPPAVFTADKKLTKGQPEWSNYVRGVVYQYLDEVPELAFNAVIISNVPLGSGLSSSAALEVAVATFIEKLYELPEDKVKKALKCQKAEHTFADTPCGIMDQYISAMGQKGNLLLIDCRSREFSLVPYGTGPDAPVILVTNSNVKHALSGSEYPDRVKQCQDAVKALQKMYPQVHALRDATLDMLEAVRGNVSDIVYKRAKHVITENARTLETAAALKAHDYVEAGRCMTQSHFSLQHDYEVSCEELDFLVKCALTVSGVHGSRITGGGFGGCMVTLVERKHVEELKKALSDNYFKQYHKRCEMYVAQPEQGAGVFEQDETKCDECNTCSASWMETWAVPIAALGFAVAVGLMLLRNKK